MRGPWAVHVTRLGAADMPISPNTTEKVIEGHYTCHVESIITRPRNAIDVMDESHRVGPVGPNSIAIVCIFNSTTGARDDARELHDARALVEYGTEALPRLGAWPHGELVLDIVGHDGEAHVSRVGKSLYYTQFAIGLCDDSDDDHGMGDAEAVGRGGGGGVQYDDAAVRVWLGRVGQMFTARPVQLFAPTLTRMPAR
jgi:hypothetical protein